MKIARLTYEGIESNLDVELNILGTKGTIEFVTFAQEGGSIEKLIKDLQPYEAIITDYVPLTKEILSKLDNCKVISVAATGFTSVDVVAAKEKGIVVCAIGEYCTQEVADHAMTLMLALQRRLLKFNKVIQEDKKWDWSVAPDIERVEGQTIGILGFGKIGQAVGKRAKAFGLNVIAYDPYLPSIIAEKQGVKLMELDDVLGESDIISVHMAVDNSNKGFLDYDKFKKMKKQPFLVNVSRGAAIEEPDLVRTLDEGLIKGAGIDVLITEDPVLEGHPLVGRENVILTPHIAFYSKTSMYFSSKITIENLINVLEGNLDKTNKIVN
jgi:D-3-phosphoglycerate dehydrogenase